jgi:hypothetical protein
MIAGLSEESSAFLYAYDLSRCSLQKIYCTRINLDFPNQFDVGINTGIWLYHSYRQFVYAKSITQAIMATYWPETDLALQGKG